MLVRIPHHPGHTWQCRQFFGCPLRITPGDQDAAIWIEPLQPPDRSARVLIGTCGDRAGIEHYNFGVPRGRGSLHAAVQELTF